jgi:hypothetical protein
MSVCPVIQRTHSGLRQSAKSCDHNGNIQRTRCLARYCFISKIRPFHHGRNGQSMWLVFQHLFCSLKLLARPIARRSHAPFRHPTTTHCTRIAHEMPTIAKLPSSSWPTPVGRKGRLMAARPSCGGTMRSADPILAALSVDRNETPVSARIGRLCAPVTACRLMFKPPSLQRL